MKNIPGFAAFVSIILLCSAGARANAQDSAFASFFDMEIRTGVGFGAMAGEAKELVYIDSEGDELMSELIWPYAPLYYWGASLTGASRQRTKPGFFFSIGAKGGIPAVTGRMTDKDWLSAQGFMTHFSAHDCHTEGALFADLRIGASFPIFGWFTLHPSVAVSHMRLSWTAQDGYVQYGQNASASTYIPWREDFTKIPVYGTGIAYAQQWNTLSVGLGISKRILPRLEAQAGAYISPLVYCEDQDDHFLRSPPLQYKEAMSGGRGIEPFASAAYAFNESATLRLEYSYRYLDRTRGTTTVRAIGTGQKYGTFPDGAGAAYGVHDAGLVLTVRL